MQNDYQGKDRRISGIITRRKDDFVCVFHDRQNQEYDRCFTSVKSNMREIEKEMRSIRQTMSEKMVSWKWFSLILAIIIAVFSGTATIGGFVARDLSNRMIISSKDVDSALTRQNSIMNDISNRQINLMSNQNRLMKNQKVLLKFFDLDPESADRTIKIK